MSSFKFHYADRPMMEVRHVVEAKFNHEMNLCSMLQKLPDGKMLVTHVAMKDVAYVEEPFIAPEEPKPMFDPIDYGAVVQTTPKVSMPMEQVDDIEGESDVRLMGDEKPETMQ